jgi:hypothetical protein
VFSSTELASYVGFGVFADVIMKNAVLWDVCMDLVRTFVSEELVSSVFRVEKKTLARTVLDVC